MSMHVKINKSDSCLQEMNGMLCFSRTDLLEAGREITQGPGI